MNITIKDSKTGVEKTMSERFAKILVKMGRATYVTRDMVAAPVVAFQPVIDAANVAEAVKPAEIAPKPQQKRTYMRRNQG